MTTELPRAVGAPLERQVRRVVEGEMPPEGLNVLFWVRGSWRCGQWLQRDDGICWVVEGTSWVEPSVWDSRMQRPTHWMPQPEAPNVQGEAPSTARTKLGETR